MDENTYISYIGLIGPDRNEQFITLDHQKDATAFEDCKQHEEESLDPILLSKMEILVKNRSQEDEDPIKILNGHFKIISYSGNSQSSMEGIDL
jgi:hypothetical protein